MAIIYRDDTLGTNVWRIGEGMAPPVPEPQAPKELESQFRMHSEMKGWAIVNKVGLSELRGRCMIERLTWLRFKAYVHLHAIGYKPSEIATYFNRERTSVSHGIRRGLDPSYRRAKDIKRCKDRLAAGSQPSTLTHNVLEQERGGDGAVINTQADSPPLGAK